MDCGDNIPAVAVVIPAYNAAATLAVTLESLLSQTMCRFEAVITDDGSTDATFEVAAQFARRDSRLKVVRQSNRGPAEARNAGIHQTRAPFIAALDADDIWHRTFLEKLCSTLQRGGRDTVAAYANSRIIDMEDRVLRSAPAHRHSGWVFNQLLVENFVGNGSAMMFRREPLLQVGAYEPRLHYCEDWLMALRLSACGKVAAVPEYLVGYRAVPGARSENTLQMRRSRLAALRILFSEIDCSGSRVARWALGTTHAKCFLRELRALRVGKAARSLAAALRYDFRGTCHLLLGSQRFNWLAGKIRQRGSSPSERRFQDFDPLEGQWQARTSGVRQLRVSEIEYGPVAPLDRKAAMSQAKIV